MHTLPDELVAWIREVTGATSVAATRRVGGASREGWAIDVVDATGSPRPLWLRLDGGHGPQSDGVYTLRREAAVFRALAGTAVRVPRVVAVHPGAEAFLAERVPGRTWFSEITDPAEQVAVARDFIEQLAALHRIDPATLDLPGIGPPRTIREHVREEIDIWEAQHLERHGPRPDPLIVFALRWLRRNVPRDEGPVVLVQGDTGPGNFLYEDGRVTALVDFELAHLGDPHDDLAWICVRDLQERFTDLTDRFTEYEASTGTTIDAERLRYFRVLAQARCAIGTVNGLGDRSAGAETANHLIYSTLHLRVLAEALADAVGVSREAVLPDDPGGETDDTWLFDAALSELRDVIVPGSPDPFVARRAKGLARMMKYLRELDRRGAALAQDDAVDRARVDLGPEGDEQLAVAYFLRRMARRTELMRPAMGALADRRYSPIRWVA